MKHFRKGLDRLFSTSAAGLYMILFAFSIGAATFVENDFGTSSAQKMIFKAWWFELLLILFGISLIVNIIRFRMAQQNVLSSSLELRSIWGGLGAQYKLNDHWGLMFEGCRQVDLEKGEYDFDDLRLWKIRGGLQFTF